MIVIVDAALLVVPASEGEFESSMKENSQTREHALLLHSLGVSRLIVAVNKMDITQPSPFSESRFRYIESCLRSFLQDELTFQPDRLTFVPVSGFLAENLISCSGDCPLIHWYHKHSGGKGGGDKGGAGGGGGGGGDGGRDGDGGGSGKEHGAATLLEAMEQLAKEVHHERRRGSEGDKSLRAVVVGLEGVEGGGQRLAIRVLQGSLRIGRRYAYYCSSEASATEASSLIAIVKVTKLSRGSASTGCGDEVRQLIRGDRGTAWLSPPSSKSQGKEKDREPLLANVGTLLFKGPGKSPVISGTVKATISAVAKLPTPIIPGACFEMYLGGTETLCHLAKIHRLLTPGTHPPFCVSLPIPPLNEAHRS